MEGVPRMPMLEIELKQNSSDYTSLDWAGIPSDDTHEVIQTQLTEALKKHIEKEYSDDPEKYNDAIQKLLEVQSAAYKAILSADFEGCNALKKYYGQLHYMQSRFPFSGDDGLKVTLSWQDAFTGILTVHETFSFEQTAILFNIGAMHSILGASDSRMTEEGIRISCVHFQCAAGLFTYIAEHLDTTLSPDISQLMLKLFINVMLAQGQECLLEKSMQDNRKHSIVSKISQQVVDYYKLCLQSLENRETENVLGSTAHKSWKRMINFKVSYYSAITKYFTGNNALEQDKYGQSVAYFGSAVAHLKELTKLLKGFSKETRATVGEALKFTSDVLNGKYNSSVKDNNFVYHDKVPDLATLPEVKGASLVKALAFEPANEQLTGPDIFAKLVPMEAHLAASTYSEKKAKLLRVVVEKVDAKNEILAQYKISIELDPGKLINPEESAKLDQTLVEKCAQYSVDKTSIVDLKEATDGLTEAYNDLNSALEDTFALVENEETEDTKFQDAAGKDAFAIEEDVEGIKKELATYEEIQSKISGSNGDLQMACRLHIQNMKIVSEGLDTVKEELKLTDIAELITEEDRGDIDLVRKLCDKVVEMELQRESLMTQLRQQMNSDDVTSTLVTKHGVDQEGLFEEELKKYDSLIDTINKNLAAQDNILNAVTEANARYTNIRKAVEREKDRVAQRTYTLVESCECLPTMLKKCTDGKKFFSEIAKKARGLHDRVKEFCDENEEKRKSIYNKIEEKKKPPPRPSAPKPKLGTPKSASSLPAASPVAPMPPGGVLSPDALAKMMAEDEDELLDDPEFLQFLQNQGDLQSMQLAATMPGSTRHPRMPGPGGSPHAPQNTPHTAYRPGVQSPAYPAASMPSAEDYNYHAANVPPRPAPQPTPPHIPQSPLSLPFSGHVSYSAERGAPRLTQSPQRAPTSARYYPQRPEPAPSPGQFQLPNMVPVQRGSISSSPMPQSVPLSQPTISMLQAAAHASHGSVTGMPISSVSTMNQSMAAPQSLSSMPQGMATVPQYGAMTTPLQIPDASLPTAQYVAPAVPVYQNNPTPQSVTPVPQNVPPLPYQSPAPHIATPQNFPTSMAQYHQNIPQSGAVAQQMVPHVIPQGTSSLPPQMASSANMAVPRSVQVAYHNPQQQTAAAQGQPPIQLSQVAIVLPPQSVAISYPQPISQPVGSVSGSNAGIHFSQSDTAVHLNRHPHLPTVHAQQASLKQQQMGQVQLQQPGAIQAQYPQTYSQTTQPMGEPMSSVQYQPSQLNIQQASVPQQPHVLSHPQQYYPQVGGYRPQTQPQGGVNQQPAVSQPHPVVSGQPNIRPPCPFPQQTVNQHGSGVPRQLNPQHFQSLPAPQQSAQQDLMAPSPMGQSLQQQNDRTLQSSGVQGYQRFSGPQSTSMTQCTPSSFGQVGIPQDTGGPHQTSQQGVHHSQGPQMPYLHRPSLPYQNAVHNAPPQGTAMPYQSQPPQGIPHLAGQQMNQLDGLPTNQRYEQPLNQGVMKQGPARLPATSVQPQWSQAAYRQNNSQMQVRQLHHQEPIPTLQTYAPTAAPQTPAPASMPQASTPAVPQMSASMPQLSGPNLQGSSHHQPTRPQATNIPQQPAPGSNNRQLNFTTMSEPSQQGTFTPQALPHHQSSRPQDRKTSQQHALSNDNRQANITPMSEPSQQGYYSPRNQRPAPASQENYSFKSQPHPGKYTSTPSNESSPKHVPKNVVSTNSTLHMGVLTPTPVVTAARQPPVPKQPSSDLAGLILTPMRSLSSSADEMLLSSLDHGTNLVKSTAQVVLVPTKIDETSDTMVVRPVEGLPYMDEADLMKFKAEVEELRSKVADLLQKPSNHGLCNLDKEWKRLSDTQEKHSRPLSTAIARCSSYKNRFQDVVPFDQSRIVLKQAKDDYINASIIDGVSPYCPRFIATQSPLPNTVSDFWTMVYEQQVNLIVMLVNSKDVPRKCPMYWPADRTVPQQHGPLTVSFTTSKTHGDLYIERTFTVKHRNQSLAMSVTQLQFIAWPEHRIPSSASDLLSFVHVVQGYHGSQRNLQWPVLVHCESGVGRTGVFCAFVAGVNEINAGSGVMDVVDVVAKMRQKRKYMVQEKAQLKFVYDVILFHAIDVLKQRNVVLSDEVKAAPSSSLPVNSQHPANPNPKGREFDIFSDQSALSSIQATVEKMTIKPGADKGVVQGVFRSQPRVESKSCHDIPSYPVDPQPNGASAVRPNTSETLPAPRLPVLQFTTNEMPVTTKIGDLSDLVQGTIANSPAPPDTTVQTSPKPDVVESCNGPAKSTQEDRSAAPSSGTRASPSNLIESLTPEAFTLDANDDVKRKQKITKEDFYKPGSGLSAENDPADPFSALDPLWGLKK